MWNDRLAAAAQRIRDELLAQLAPSGHWEGELSTSALSTATAVWALELVRRHRGAAGHELQQPIAAGLRWLAEHQNRDGGWGDTIRSVSNISTTMLTHALFYGAGAMGDYPKLVSDARDYIARAGGVPALKARYGKDKTFSVPILTHCALAGLVAWKEVPRLPFELAVLPHRFFQTIQLPVVSYALPALIAIGQLGHHQRPVPGPWRFVRNAAIAPSLRVLERIQPTSGGFLEATPLTAFVTMSLTGKGLGEHVVAQRGTEFLLDSRRPDGSWPVDTNLATWVTTLSINALGPDLPPERAATLCDWLCGQQYRVRHPYTNAAPGGWAWTDLSGGVPDADDTPGAILALIILAGQLPERAMEIAQACQRGVAWLLDLQNRDDGWPTFCRGWGALPFDRSAADITAHAVRAIAGWQQFAGVHLKGHIQARFLQRCEDSVRRGFACLARTQGPEGAWLPLWFGNQAHPADENPVYGTARVLAAYRDTGRLSSSPAIRGIVWLCAAQHESGGWGGFSRCAPSVEETALALDALSGWNSPDSGISSDLTGKIADAVTRGGDWLAAAIEREMYLKPSPIGFYFAKLWYFEKLYPLAFAASALRRIQQRDTGSRAKGVGFGRE